MGNPLEVLFVVSILALWVLFPMGVFIAVGRLDKNSNQLEILARRRLAISKKAAREVSNRGRIRLPELGAGYNKLLKH